MIAFLLVLSHVAPTRASLARPVYCTLALEDLGQGFLEA